MTLKIGDRVYFDYNPNNPKVTNQRGFGEILDICRFGEEVYYEVVQDGEDRNDEYYSPWIVEPVYGELIVPEKLYNSKLYKALK